LEDGNNGLMMAYYGVTGDDGNELVMVMMLVI